MDAKQAAPSIAKRRPDSFQTPIRYQVMRVPVNGFKNVVCLSHDIVGFDTHYMHRRTSICLPANCSGCDGGHTKRWYGWIAAAPLALDRIDIVQITAAAAASFDAYFRSHRTLRGAVIDLRRVPAVPNGRMFASLHKHDIAPEKLPKAPNVESIILNMMGVSEDQLIPTDVQIAPVLKGVPGDNGDDKKDEALRGDRLSSISLRDGMERTR